MTISIIGQAGTFATIQAAVTAAANGATISVTAGTYTENVTSPTSGSPSTATRAVAR